MTTATGTAAATGGTSDPRPYVRIAAALRRAITDGAIPPGTRLDPADMAARYHAPARAAIKALNTLKGELVIWHEHRWYAAPAGPPAPAVSTRLGATLTRLRTAGAGTWQPRHFWAGCDAALGADGTLLRLHDSGYAAPARPRPPAARTSPRTAPGSISRRCRRPACTRWPRGWPPRSPAG